MKQQICKSKLSKGTPDKKAMLTPLSPQSSLGSLLTSPNPRPVPVYRLEEMEFWAEIVEQIADSGNGNGNSGYSSATT